MAEPRRGRLGRLDDTVLGAPGTGRGWYGDLLLGLHPWLRPFYVLVILIGLGLAVGGALTRQWGAVVMGVAWVGLGLFYLYVTKGKTAKPPTR